MSLMPAYLKWLPDPVKDNWLVEPLDCSQCLMTNSLNPKGAKPYRQDLKCCTFQPFIPNFSIGHILNQGGKAAHRQIERIKLGAFYLPIGEVASPDYVQRFLAKKEDDFGRRQDLLCPHMDQRSQQCSIWNQRGSECATFFCQSKFQDKGETFWSALREYLHWLEMVLVQNALLEKGFSMQEIEAQLDWLNWSVRSEVDSIRDTMNEDLSKRYWGHHETRKLEFFKEVARWSDQLQFSDLDTIGLNERPEFLNSLLEAHSALY